jgi:molybdate transport system substrate-binding protein
VLVRDVRQVLTYVETGNADAGLVYATDASETRCVLLPRLPPIAHDPIVYPVAVVKGSHNEEAARSFIELSCQARRTSIFIKHGFTIATP